MRARTSSMLEGPILSRILVFSFPIFLGLVFQTFYNLVDSIVVGKYVSADALAAVGTTSPISMLLVGMMTGFSVGASVVAAQFLGAGQKEKIKPAISTTFWFLLFFSLFLMAVGLLLSKNIMRWVNVPDNIYDDTVAYFRIYVLGLLFMALYNFFASFLRSVGDSTTPLFFLIISSVLNIFGDLFFVLVLHKGVAGVAWATVIAQGLALFIGQNIGAGQEKRAKTGLYQSTAFVVLISALMSGLILLFGPSLMQMFVNAEDAQVIEVGARFMRIWAPLIVLHAIQECFVSFLRGAGDSLFSMISMFFDLITRTVMAYVFALGVGLEFMGIAWAIPCGWLLAALCSVLRYFSGRWRSKSVV
ncbi:MAG: polysaccharide biosynthesis C-terminal domain-containing protein [Oscillospiraceae bacterium]|nr:polysaccharide biosynthesis C-terminal domain-containing protein [Bacillota bacterium]MBR0391022.1 polysaccharide biosynthesis C-terminal domain-containing protein [Oscillospiraceae bacterium]